MSWHEKGWRPLLYTTVSSKLDTHIPKLVLSTERKTAKHQALNSWGWGCSQEQRIKESSSRTQVSNHVPPSQSCLWKNGIGNSNHGSPLSGLMWLSAKHSIASVLAVGMHDDAHGADHYIGYNLELAHLTSIANEKVNCCIWLFLTICAGLKYCSVFLAHSVSYCRIPAAYRI